MASTSHRQSEASFVADAPAEPVDVFPNNLPRQLTSFIGREREKSEIKKLLLETSLLTLTGVGGSGKTRLALQIAGELLGRYADGVWLVELAPLSDPAFVPHAVASAVGIHEQTDRPLIVTLNGALRSKSLLLVLDNCEHLLAACARLADTLLRWCLNVCILATSREGLRVAGEARYPVPSLPAPDPHRLPPVHDMVRYEAVQLFAERAKSVLPAFTITERNAQAIAQLCHRLDGIPLGIELAAARVRVLGVDQVVARLDDRFRFLTGGSRTALPRHQTLRAAMDWSYSLLSGQERALLRRLSVFAGGWTLEAAEAVCSGEGIAPSDVLDLLTQLVDKSLVIADTQAGEARYRLLETLRQYALDRLLEAGEVTAVRGRHFKWYLALAEQAERALFGAHEEVWGERLETEHDNLRSALEWGMAGSGGGEAVLRFTGAMGRFWGMHGYAAEGRGWLERALSRGDDAFDPVRAKAIGMAGYLARVQGDFERAAVLGEKSLDLFLALGDKQSIAMALLLLGVLAEYRGDPAEAKRLLTECLVNFREVGDNWGLATTLSHLGEVARGQGDYDTARSFYEEALTKSREAGNPLRIAFSLAALGAVSLHRGDDGEAALLYRQALSVLIRLRVNRYIAVVLTGLGGVAVAEGRPERAVRLLGAAETLRDAIHAFVPPADRAEHEHHVSSARAGLEETAFAAAWAEGRAMMLEEAVDYAMAAENGASRTSVRGSAQPAGTTDISLLTPREREVVALVARGLSNREIAKALVITERTAESHVQHILEKLGVNSRGRIGAWAVEHGLHKPSQS